MTSDRDQLRIETSSDGVVVIGEIDAHTCDQFDHSLAGADVTTVDMQGVTFMDSSGLRVLVRHYERRASEGGSLSVVRPSRPVYRLIEITGLTALLADEPT